MKRERDCRKATRSCRLWPPAPLSGHFGSLPITPSTPPTEPASRRVNQAISVFRVNLVSGARTVSRTQDPPPPPVGLLLRRISSAAGFRSSDGCLRNWAYFRNRSPVRKKPSPFNCPSDELQKHNRFRVLHANTPNLQKELMEASETCGSIKKRNWHKPET